MFKRQAYSKRYRKSSYEPILLILWSEEEKMSGNWEENEGKKIG